MMPIPYPADTRAKGWRFELDMERARQSDTWTLASPEVRPWLLMMWATAWDQTPCGSLPDDDALIAARIGMPDKLFAKHRGILLRKWWLAEDGRLYHDVLVQRVIEMMGLRRRESDRKALARRGKKAIPPPPDGPGSPGESHASPAGVPRDTHGTTAGVHPQGGTSTSTSTRTGSSTLVLLPTPTALPAGAYEHGEYHGSPASVPRDNPLPGELLPGGPTKAGEIGLALKRAGVDPQTLCLADPRLAALIAQGATPDEFAGLAKEAISKGINSPWPWILKVLPARRAEAASLVLAPAATPPDPGAAAVGQTQQYLAEQEQHRAEAAQRTPEERAALLDRLAKLRANITDPTRKAG